MSILTTRLFYSFFLTHWMNACCFAITALSKALKAYDWDESRRWV